MSTTTRPLRNNDNRWFIQSIEKAVFEDLLRNDQFLEHAIYSNEYYGTLESSILDGFKYGPLSVKTIEVNGLLQILKSGFHDTSGIDFFISYIQPMFPDYKGVVRTRKNWQDRVEEDKKLYSLFEREIGNLIPNNKFEVINNKEQIISVASYIDVLCKNKEGKFIH